MLSALRKTLNYDFICARFLSHHHGQTVIRCNQRQTMTTTTTTTQYTMYISSAQTQNSGAPFSTIELGKTINKVREFASVCAQRTNAHTSNQREARNGICIGLFCKKKFQKKESISYIESYVTMRCLSASNRCFKWKKCVQKLSTHPHSVAIRTH